MRPFYTEAVLVSVVVPSYRGVRRLPRLLASLAAQRGVEWEAIVVLDGVVDDSPQVVDFWSKHGPIRCVPLAENQGRPAALNAGFAEAKGDVLVRCDDDLLLPRDFLAHHAAHHTGEPVGVIGMCEDVFDDTAYARAYGRDADRNIRTHAYDLPPGETWRLWSANVSVTRETFDRVGPYDVDYRVYGWEDVDWGYRLHQLGVPVIIPDDVECQHLAPATTARERALKARASGASRRLFQTKHPDAQGVDAPGRELTPWNVAVGAASLVARTPLLGPVGRGVDAMLPHVPAKVGHKLVSLVVEGAGRAG